MANHDPAYGVWACLCVCRRRRPSKDDHDGCVHGGCEPEFITRAELAEHNLAYGGSPRPRGKSLRRPRGV